MNKNRSLIKTNISFFLLVIILFLSTNFFARTPFEKVFFYIQALYLIFIALFVFSYLVTNLQKRAKVNKEIIVFLFVVFFGIVYSAIRAKQVFDQPLIYGILSQRKWLLVETGFLLYYWLNTKKISIQLLEHVFVFFAWLSLFVYVTIYFYFSFFNSFKPFDISKLGGFVNFSQSRGLRLHLNHFFITFGIIYYFIKSEIKQKKFFLLSFLIFLFYLLFIHKGRTYLLFIIFICSLFLWVRYPLKIRVLKFLKLFVLVGVVFLGGILFFPDYIERLFFLYEQMFKVLTGKMTYDSSANARLSQVLIVFDFFKSNPKLILLGVGKLSHQWNSGFNGILGYFYPTDIGLIGIVFVYGVVGFFVVYLFPSFKMLKLTLKINDKKENNSFILTLKYVLLFILLNSILTGNIVFTPYVFSFPYFILYFYVKNKDSL